MKTVLLAVLQLGIGSFASYDCGELIDRAGIPSSPSDPRDSPGTGSAGSPAEPVAELRAQLITPSALYSAYDGVHDYRITASIQVVEGDSDPIALDSIQWIVDDYFVADLGSFEPLPAGRVFMTKKAGVTVVKVTGNTVSGRTFRGEASLAISPANADEWTLGDARWNNVGTNAWSAPTPAPTTVAPPPTPVCGLPISIAGQIDSSSACSNCHNSMNLIAVVATPAQIGGISDADITRIVADGEWPSGRPFKSPFLLNLPPDSAPCIFQSFHEWPVDEATVRGLIWKMRSLPPTLPEPSAAVPVPIPLPIAGSGS